MVLFLSQRLPPKRPELPPSLMRMKDEPEVEEEEEEEEEEEKEKEDPETKKMEDGNSGLQQEMQPELVQGRNSLQELTCPKETEASGKGSSFSWAVQRGSYGGKVGYESQASPCLGYTDCGRDVFLVVFL